MAVAGGRVLHADALAAGCGPGKPACCCPSTSTCASGHLDVVYVQRQPQSPAARSPATSSRSWPPATRHRRTRSARRADVLRLRHRQPGHRRDRRRGLFNRIWDQAGLPRPAGGQQPRPYDFRHHFAYANVERWMAQGKDVTAMLPYLARYMGHAEHRVDVLLHPHLARLPARLRRPHRPEPVAAAGGRDSNETRPDDRHPGLLQLRPGLPAHLPAHGPADAHRRRSRPTGSAWNASSTTWPTTSTSTAPTSASTTSTGTI